MSKASLPPRVRDEKPQPVTTTRRVHPAVYKTAYKYAGGRPERINVLSYTHVEVTRP